MTHDARNDRETHERNAAALRQTRRELDADIAAVADTGDGAEALEAPADPDHATGCAGAVRPRREPS